MNDDELDARLAAMELRVPVDGGQSAPVRQGRSRRRLASLVVAPVLVALLAGTAVGVSGLVRGFTFSSSGELQIDPLLASAGLECMTKSEAEAWLAARGYDRVVWERGYSGTIEAGIEDEQVFVATPDPSPSFAGDGAVIVGPTIDDTLHMVFIPGASRAPTCPAQ